MAKFKTVLLAVILLAVATLTVSSNGASTETLSSPKQDFIKGRYLFYFPMVTKSVTITFMPVAEALRARGHEVVVFDPFPRDGKKKDDGLQYEFLDCGVMEHFKMVSTTLLKVCNNNYHS